MRGCRMLWSDIGESFRDLVIDGGEIMGIRDSRV